MTLEEKQKIKTSLILLAAYYQTKLLDEVIVMYAEDLADLTFHEVAKALNDWRRNPKNDRPPLPAKIRSMILPSEDDDALARDAAARIIAAVSKFGYANPADAREYIGSLGWSVVEKQGGWYNIATSQTNREIPMLQAQYRDLAKAHLILARQGRLERPPELPAPEHSENLQLGSMIQKLTTTRTMEDK